MDAQTAYLQTACLQTACLQTAPPTELRESSDAAGSALHPRCRMKLLILGGTRFLGRHLADQALAQGHIVTLMHRGRSGPGLFPQAEHRIADRDGDLAALAGGEWDSVIDTSAYAPRQVHAMAAKLAGRVGQYQLVSTISVYADMGAGGLAEDAALQVLPDPLTEALTGDTYGGLKVLCEQAAQAGFAGRCLISRPGLLVGPHDPTGRFSWWVQRLQRGGTVLAPGDPSTPVQLIDARDAAAWMLLQATRHTTGVFNLTGPAHPITIGGLLDTARSTLNPAAQLQWVDEKFLLDAGVAPWSDLPVWLPRAQAGLHRVDIARALATGLQCRPLADTLSDTALWLQDRVPPPADPAAPPRPPAGLAPEREAALLQAWRARLAR